MNQGAGMRTCIAVAALFFLAVFLQACEGVVSGTEIARVPLQTAEGGAAGAYAPVKFTLSPVFRTIGFSMSMLNNLKCFRRPIGSTHLKLEPTIECEKFLRRMTPWSFRVLREFDWIYHKSSK